MYFLDTVVCQSFLCVLMNHVNHEYDYLQVCTVGG